MEMQGNIPQPVFSSVSTILTIKVLHGGFSAVCTLRNATRLLYAFAPHLSSLIVHPGASKPLIRPSRHVRSVT